METTAGDLEGLVQTSTKVIQKEPEAGEIMKEAPPEETIPASRPESQLISSSAVVSASIVEPTKTIKAEISNSQDVPTAWEVPDPDEDDLDDLDGQLSFPMYPHTKSHRHAR